MKRVVFTVIFTLILTALLTPLLVPTSRAQTVRFRSGIFLHHSTGGCIWGPNGSSTSVPIQMAQPEAISDFYAAHVSDLFCTRAKETLATGLDPVTSSFPPNVYLCRLEAGRDRVTLPIVVLR